MWKYFTHDMAIDLGTANTLVALKGYGIILNEPSVVAINNNTKELLAVGVEARKMIGRTPGNVSAVRPLQDGVIHDFNTTEVMIRYFITKAHELYPKLIKIAKPRVVIGVPSTITEVEMNAVVDAAKLAGARKVYIVLEPMAAAVGARLDVEQPTGSMIIDIGGGTTDIAVLSLGGIVIDNTVKIAGDEMNQEIVNYARHKYNLLIGENMAEDVKIALGIVHKVKDVEEIELRGRDMISGLPKKLKITNVEIKEVLESVLDRIIEWAKDALERTPPQLLSDILQNGISLAGGGSLIKGIDKYFAERLKTPVHIVPEPLHAVVNGLTILLDDIDLLEKVQVKETNFV